MVGRSRRSRRRDELPEDEQLRRADPELFELVDEVDPPVRGDGRGRASS